MKESNRAFEECIEELIEKRIELINDDIAKTEWYNDIQDKLIEIQNRSSEIKNLLIEYNSINEVILQETAATIYRQAFLDGVEAAMTMAPSLAPKR